MSRALYQASRNLELNETLRYLEKDVQEKEKKTGKKNANPFSNTANYPTFRMKTKESNPVKIPKAMILINDQNSNNEASRSLQEIVKNRYVYQKALLDEVVMNMLYSASDKPLKERVNFKILDQDIKAEPLTTVLIFHTTSQEQRRTDVRFIVVPTTQMKVLSSLTHKCCSATIHRQRWA